MMETVSLRESATEVLVVGVGGATEGTVNSAPVLRLRLKKPKPDRKVGWREGTVDNEDMGKKKSKCCCIYKKPVNFGESSSSDEEECEHCFGHPEKRRKNMKHDQNSSSEICNIDSALNGDEDNNHEHGNKSEELGNEITTIN